MLSPARHIQWGSTARPFPSMKTFRCFAGIPISDDRSTGSRQSPIGPAAAELHSAQTTRDAITPISGIPTIAFALHADASYADIYHINN